MRQLCKDEGRIDWVDCAKGVAMLLVILAHTISNQVLQGAIYSFHMPLFFLLGGVTYKKQENGTPMKNRIGGWFRRLVMIPLSIFIIRKILIIIRDGCSFGSVSNLWECIGFQLHCVL